MTTTLKKKNINEQQNENDNKFTYKHFFLLFLNQKCTPIIQLKNDLSMISASRFSAVFGVSDHLTKQAVWSMLHGIKAKESSFRSEAMDHGNREEPYSRKRFYEVWKERYPHREFSFRQEGWGVGFYQKDPRFSASPDGIFTWQVDQKIHKEGLELKNPWSKPIPKEKCSSMCGYVLQCVLNMEVFDIDLWNLFYYDRRTKEYSWFRIHRNKEFFETFLLPYVDKFIAEEKPPRSSRGTKTQIADAILNHFRVDAMEYYEGNKNEVVL